MLVRQDGERIERLHEGGPVLGLLPDALYSTGMVKIEDRDKLIVYSDGIIEAANEDEEEFGEARIAEIISDSRDVMPETLCERIVKQVTAFASFRSSAGRPHVDGCQALTIGSRCSRPEIWRHR